ncbi:hypothetical protein Tco_1455684 [Tanacetum coccineum]
MGGIGYKCGYLLKRRKVLVLPEKLKAARDRQKSYADNRRKPLEFEVGDRVMLKVSPWKGVVHFGKKGKLAPRYVGPFEILERIGPVAYRLRLPEELKPVEISDRQVKRLECSRIVLVKGEVHVVGWFFSLGVVMLLFVPLCGQAKLFAVRYFVIDYWNSKRGPELA